MPDAASVVSAAHDPKGKLVSIFVGAVLLPSTALSVVSFHAIPRQAEATQITLTKRAERVLYYVEEDLERTARSRALEAARAIGPERLLEGRQELIQVALVKAGLPENMFDSLRLEGSSPMSRLRAALNVQERDVEALREALNVTDA